MFKSILLAVDLDDQAAWEKTLPIAIQQARASNGNLHILTVVPDFGMSVVGQFFPDNYTEKMAEKLLKHIKDFEDEHVPEDVNSRCIVGEGTVYETILKISKEVKADLIVIGAHRPDLKDYLLGPNAARVVRHATASVMVVRA
ncbi:MAG: universal stress protein [Rhodospirillales bacterium]|nr:universal stress protein [Rhodospirillales bacterium]